MPDKMSHGGIEPTTEAGARLRVQLGTGVPNVSARHEGQAAIKVVLQGELHKGVTRRIAIDCTSGRREARAQRQTRLRRGGTNITRRPDATLRGQQARAERPEQLGPKHVETIPAREQRKRGDAESSRTRPREKSKRQPKSSNVSRSAMSQSPGSSSNREPCCEHCDGEAVRTKRYQGQSHARARQRRAQGGYNASPKCWVQARRREAVRCEAPRAARRNAALTAVSHVWGGKAAGTAQARTESTNIESRARRC